MAAAEGFTLPAASATQFMRCSLDYTGLQSMNGSNGVSTISIALGNQYCAWQAYNLDGSGVMMVNVLGTGLGSDQLPVTRLTISNNFFGGYSAVNINIPNGPSVDTLSLRLCVWASAQLQNLTKITVASNGFSNSNAMCVVKNEDTGDQITLSSTTQNDLLLFTAAG